MGFLRSVCALRCALFGWTRFRFPFARILGIFAFGAICAVGFAQVGGPPGPPTGVTATGGPGEITINFNGTLDDGYNYQAQGSSSSSFTSPYNVPIHPYGIVYQSPLYAQDTTCTPGVTYYYHVRREYSDDTVWSVWSATVSAVCRPIAPTLSGTAGNTAANLSWNSVTGAANYLVYQSTDNTNFTYVKTVSAPATTTSVTGLTNNTPYYFYITASTSNNYVSPNSNHVNVTPIPPPQPPTGLTATPGNAQIVLNWNASATATSYRIYRSLWTNGQAGPYNYLAPTTGLTYTDTGLTNGQLYLYFVIAGNSAGWSTNSNVAWATPVAPPVAPTLSGVRGDGRNFLTWNTPTNATSFKLYWNTVNNGTFPNSIPNVTSTYPHTGLTNGTTYYYAVTALDAGGESPKSNVVGPLTPTALPPDTPTGLATVGANNQVTANWNGVYNALSYTLAHSASQNGPFTTFWSGSATTAPDNNLNNGVTYWYEVQATNAQGSSAWSAPVSGTPIGAPPIPTNVAATGQDGSITVTWTASIGASWYKVYASTDTNTANATVVYNGPYQQSGTPFPSPNGTKKYIWVTAGYLTSESGFSSMVNATPWGAPQPPTVTAVGANQQVTLSWNSDSNIQTYVIKRSTTHNGPYTTIKPDATGTTYLDTPLDNGTTYYYVIDSVNPLGTSADSAEVAATPFAPLAAPLNVTVTVTAPKTVHVHWDLVDNATGYVVQYWIDKQNPIIQVFDTLSGHNTVDSTHDLDFNTGYKFNVYATNQWTQSPTSTIVGGTTYPDSPKNPQATGGKNQISLSWDAVTSGTLSLKYHVYRSDVSGGPYTDVTPSGLTTNSYADQGLAQDQTEYYVITAKNSAGLESAHSVEVSAYADPPDLRGTDFWTAFPPVNHTGVPDPTPELFIQAGDVNANVTITLPDGTVNHILVQADSSYEYDITNQNSLLEMVQNDVVANQGVHVTSDQPVDIHAVLFAEYTSDNYSVLPTASLGKQHLVIAYPTEVDLGTGNGNTTTAIVGTHDNTTVTITPSVDCGTNKKAHEPYTIPLNAGQTYLLQSKADYADLTGTEIDADQKIAVYSGSQQAQVPGHINLVSSNAVYEPMISVDRWGTDFFAGHFLFQREDAQTYGTYTRAHFILRVLASRNGTTVSINKDGSQTTETHALDRGQMYEGTFTQNVHVWSDNDKPILVAEFGLGAQDDTDPDGNRPADPTMVLVPAVSQYISSAWLVGPASGWDNTFANAIIDTPHLQNLLGPTGNQIFNTVALPDGYTMVQYAFKRGIRLVTTTDPDHIHFGIIHYGSGDYDFFSHIPNMQLHSTPLPSIPAPVLTNLDQSGTTITLSWTYSGPAITGFKIEREELGPTPSGWTQVQSAGPAATSCQDTIPSGAIVAYRMYAYNDLNSPYSNVLNNENHSAPTLSGQLADPQGVTVNLSWTRVVGVQKYIISRIGDLMDADDYAEPGPNDISTTDTALYNSDFTYTIRGHFADGTETARSNPIEIRTVPGPPPVPTVTPGDHKLTLTWLINSLYGPATFKVYHSTDNSNFTYAGTSTTGTSYEDDGLDPTKIYYYKLTGNNAVGEGPMSSPSASGQPMDGNGAPSNLIATAILPSEIDLHWTAAATTPQHYIVDWRHPGDTSWTPITVDPSPTAYQHTNLPAAAYEYQVVADYGNGNLSTPTNIASTTLDQSLTTPTELSATVISASEIDLSWTDDATDWSQFEVVEVNGDGSLTKVGSSPTTHFNATGLTANTTYTFRVRATHSSDLGSPYSIEASATTSEGNSVPVYLASVAFDANVLLSGSDAIGTVTLSGLATVDHVITLTSSNVNVAVPSTITVPAGSSSASFVAHRVASDGLGTFSFVVAKDGSWSQRATIGYLESSDLAISDLSVTSGNAGVWLRWGELTSLAWGNTVAGYIVSRSTDGADYQALISVPIRSGYFVDSTVSQNHDYRYRIDLVDPTGQVLSSVTSNSVSYTSTASSFSWITVPPGTVSGKVTLVATNPDITQSAYSVLIDGELESFARNVADNDFLHPKISSTLDTRQLSNGQHVVRIVSVDSSSDLYMSDPLTINVNNNFSQIAADKFVQTGDNLGCEFSATLQTASNFTITVKNQAGQTIRDWTGNGVTAKVVWDGKDSSGNAVPDGTYTCDVEKAPVGPPDDDHPHFDTVRVRADPIFLALSMVDDDGDVAAQNAYNDFLAYELTGFTPSLLVTYDSQESFTPLTVMKLSRWLSQSVSYFFLNSHGSGPEQVWIGQNITINSEYFKSGYQNPLHYISIPYLLDPNHTPADNTDDREYDFVWLDCCDTAGAHNAKLHSDDQIYFPWLESAMDEPTSYPRDDWANAFNMVDGGVCMLSNGLAPEYVIATPDTSLGSAQLVWEQYFWKGYLENGLGIIDAAYFADNSLPSTALDPNPRSEAYTPNGRRIAKRYMATRTEPH